MKTCNDAPVSYTDHPPVGEWQGWNGGVCPVHPLARIEYVLAGGATFKDTADQLEWSREGDDWDIVRYRIVGEYKAPVEKKPREVYIVTSPFGERVYNYPAHGATLFREVIQ